MNTTNPAIVIETIVVAYEEFEKVATKLGKDPNSLKDFIELLKIFLEKYDK